jgi:hypothetical protein
MEPNSQEPSGDSQASDISDRVNKIMRSLSTRTHERDLALAEAAEAQAELAAIKAQLEQSQERAPMQDLNRPLRQTQPQPTIAEKLTGVSWADLGVRDR